MARSDRIMNEYVTTKPEIRQKRFGECVGRRNNAKREADGDRLGEIWRACEVNGGTVEDEIGKR